MHQSDTNIEKRSIQQISNSRSDYRCNSDMHSLYAWHANLACHAYVKSPMLSCVVCYACNPLYQSYLLLVYMVAQFVSLLYMLTSSTVVYYGYLVFFTCLTLCLSMFIQSILCLPNLISLYDYPMCSAKADQYSLIEHSPHNFKPTFLIATNKHKLVYK